MVSPLETLLERTVEGMGYGLADLEISNRGKLIRVFIEKPLESGGDVKGEDLNNGTGGISLDDCTAVTRQLQRVLPVEGVEYDRLEVSSPGLDRRLRKPADYTRFAGAEVEIRVRALVEGRRRMVGVLLGLQGDEARVEMEGRIFTVSLSNIDRARLVPQV